MEMQQALQQLETLQKKQYALRYAESSINLDADTVAPKDTAEGRGVALGVLAGESQRLMTCPETKALLEELDACKSELDFLHRRQVEELRTAGPHPRRRIHGVCGAGERGGQRVAQGKGAGRFCHVPPLPAAAGGI